MAKELILRFFIGGIVVSMFAVLGDIVKPKSFAGLFSAAPSVALATLTLTLSDHVSSYVAIEGRSMVAGAVSLGVYSQVVSWWMLHHEQSSAVVTSLAVVLWFGVAFGLFQILLR